MFAEVLKAVATEHKDKQARLAAFAPKFKTQEEAFAYAQRILQLKAGDKVRLPNRDDTALHEVIFTGQCDESGDLVFIWYDPEDGRIGKQVASYSLIVLD